MSDPTPATKLANLRITDGTLPITTTPHANSITANAPSAVSAAAPPLLPRIQQQQAFVSADNIHPASGELSSCFIFLFILDIVRLAYVGF